MPYYRLFGGILDADLELPELSPAEATGADWVLRSSSDPMPEPAGELLGTDRVTDDVRVRMHRCPGGFRLTFDDTGSFDVTNGGRDLVWRHPPGVSRSAAAVDLTSRVMATAFHASGTVCLHASAVSIDGEAVGFMAPKHHGKSTLALSLVAAGARLLTDDTLPIEPSDPPRARPGLHSARLWPDSAALLRLPDGEASEGGKRRFPPPPEDLLTHAAVPLGALYLLAPVDRLPDDRPVARTRLSSVEASLAIVGNARLAPLLMKAEGSVLFAHAAAVTRRVPVYRLQLVRDLDRIGEVVSALASWHGSTRPLAGSRGRA